MVGNLKKPFSEKSSPLGFSPGSKPNEWTCFDVYCAVKGMSQVTERATHSS